MVRENEKLRRYLLNLLDEHEMRDIDFKIISEQGMETELLMAENDLMEDYLENSLTGEELARFENDFMINEERRSSLEFLKLIKGHARAAAHAPEPVIYYKSSFKQNLFQLFWDYRIPVLAAAAIILVAFSVYWMIPGRAPRYEYVAQLNSGDLSNFDGLKELPVFNLASGSFRNAGPPAIKLNAGSGNILFRLALPPEFKDETPFNIELTQNDTQVLTLDKVRTYANAAGREIRLILPSNVLSKGSYQVKVRKGEESPLVYSFNVE